MEPRQTGSATELTLEAIATDVAVPILVGDFVPTPRFAHVSFDNYQPAAGEPSQAAARERVQRFVADLPREGPTRRAILARWLRPKPALRLRGLYLDGGFGVGKTHLLAAAWYAAPAPKSYLSFAELAYTITSVGIEESLAAFRGQRLLCIDEFELDDVANTRLAATLLRGLRDAGNGPSIIATSNTLPTDLGAGRFAADDFRQEIGEIAATFETVHIEGEDYRHRPRWEGTPAGAVLSSDALRAAYAAYRPRAGARVLTSARALQARLAELHPIRYARLLRPMEALFVEGLAPMMDQGAALRFVHLVDKLYDQQVRLTVSATCELQDLFLAEYRDKGYAKKYQRCLSRLHELLAESTTV